MHEKVRRGSLVVLLLMLIPMEIAAQNRALERGMHGGEFSIGMIDHAYVGSEITGGNYDYQGVGVGLSYIGNQVRASLLFGRSGEPRTFLDISAVGWLAPSFARVRRENTTLSMPMGFLTAWRRTTAEKNVEPLGATAILFGAGGELVHSFNERARVRLRAIPLVGITGSQIVDAVGLSWAVDAEARFFVAEVFSHLGLSIGYTFRYQLWNINGSRSFSDSVDEVYDYASQVHILSAGIWF
ncbi:MAG: hypothetical protein OXH34_08535 [Bacteroidetes bacterium]|nr:hypothetical protein [Bacteroidota bacterium]